MRHLQTIQVIKISRNYPSTLKSATDPCTLSLTSDLCFWPLITASEIWLMHLASDSCHWPLQSATVLLSLLLTSYYCFLTSVYCICYWSNDLCLLLLISWLLLLTSDSCDWPLSAVADHWPATDPWSCYWPLTLVSDLRLLLVISDSCYWPLTPDLWLLTPVTDLLCCVTDLWLLLLTSDSCSSFPTSISRSPLSCPSFSSSLFSSLWANWNCTKIQNNIKYPIMGESLKVKVCINRKCNEMTFLLPSCLPFISTECH